MATPRIQSVDRAFSLLSHLARNGGCQSLPNMASGCGLTVATAHRLLATLETLGAVIHTGPGEYRIGMELVDLAGTASRDKLLAAAAEPALHTLVRSVGHTAHIGVLDPECMVTYIAKRARSGQPVPTRIGSQLEAYCSALGKVHLSAMPDHVQDAYLADGPFVALTRNTITEPETLRAELAAIHERGFAVDNEEIFDNLRCVAVPIFGRKGQVIAAMSVSLHASDTRAPDDAAIAERLRQLAADVCTKLYPPKPAVACLQH